MNHSQKQSDETGRIHNDREAPGDGGSGETLDLTAIARTLRRSRKLLVAGLVSGAILAAAAAAFLGQYESEGIYTLGAITPIKTQPQPSPDVPLAYQFAKGMGLQDFKTTYPQLDGENFRRFIGRQHMLSNASVDRLLKLVTAPQSRTQILSPVYGATRADLRELGEPSKPEENLALAIHISYSSSDPLDATNGVRLLGDFVGESLFASQAASLISKRLEQYERREVTLDNRLIQNRFMIETTGDKIKQLQAVQREFPDLAKDARQVVSVAEGGARYLSPNAQLVGLESSMADVRQDIAMNERARNVSRLLAGYYRKTRELANANLLSHDFLAALSKTISISFSSGGADTELAEARNDAMLDLYALTALTNQGLRFASGPTDGWRDGSRIWKSAIGGAAVGLLLAALVVLIVAASRDEKHSRTFFCGG